MPLILIIDDDTGSLDTYSCALESVGHCVEKAEDGVSGLGMARNLRPDLVLCDINLPGMNGWALLKELRDDPDLANTQFVFITGNERDNKPRLGMERGADDFLQKPFGFDQLVNCVQARLGRARLARLVTDSALEELRTSLRSSLPHEIFTPLGGIISVADLLLQDLRATPIEEIEELVGHIHDSALRLHRTLRNYLFALDLSELRGSNPEPKMLPPADLHDLLRRSAEIAVQRHKREQDLELSFSRTGVSCNAIDLQLIVEELVDNACSFSSVGSKIKVGLDAAGTLVVHDSGRGMTPEQIRKIGLFRQFDRNQFEQQGLGLGCYLVQVLCERSAIQFHLKSAPGAGTSAALSFPQTSTESAGQ